MLTRAEHRGVPASHMRFAWSLRGSMIIRCSVMIVAD
jgi:hypothetical protein